MCGPSWIAGDAFITPTKSADTWRSSPFVYQVRLALARRLAALRLHRRQAVSDGSVSWQCKRRRGWAGGLLWLGNAYLRMQGTPARVLPLADWLPWEQSVAQVLGREVRISAEGAGLETPFLAGDSLGEILKADLPWQDKLSALRIAADALRQLHSKLIHCSGGESWALSHGDATCHNVIVNLSPASAAWIDFDMRHEWRHPVVERHADDLRALLVSSAACLPPALHAECVQKALDGYGEPQVAAQLCKSLEPPRCPTVFQLAQGPVSYADYWRLCGLLLEVVVAQRPRRDSVVRLP